MEKFVTWLHEMTPGWEFLPANTTFGTDSEEWLIDIYSHYGYYQTVEANIIVEFQNKTHMILAKLAWKAKHVGDCGSPLCNFYYYYCI